MRCLAIFFSVRVHVAGGDIVWKRPTSIKVLGRDSQKGEGVYYRNWRLATGKALRRTKLREGH